MSDKSPSAEHVHLEPVTDPHFHHLGGTVTHRVLLDDLWVGWVGDGREWKGWHYGGRKWWACWRQDGDTAARWNSELIHPTRKAALGALLEQLAGAGS